MTARANSLTERVTKPARTSGSAWSAPASELRVLLNALGRLGYNVDTLLRSIGLRDIDFNDPDMRISCEAYGTLLSRAQQDRFTPDLALELARLTPMGAYPLLDYLVLTSETVGAAVQQLGRYFRLVGNPVVITVHEDVDPIRVEIVGPAPFATEYVASLMVLHCRNETDGLFVAANVSLRPRPSARDVGPNAPTAAVSRRGVLSGAPGRRPQGSRRAIHQRAYARDWRGRVLGRLFRAGSLSSRVQAMVRDDTGGLPAEAAGPMTIRLIAPGLQSSSLRPES
jgi:hypothetical protein